MANRTRVAPMGLLLPLAVIVLWQLLASAGLLHTSTFPLRSR